jgi:high affinity Mn2+ porin
VFRIGSVIRRSFPFTADYQLIANRTCNADRGSVSIFSGRLHGKI